MGKFIINFLKLGKFEGVGSMLGTERKRVNSHYQNSCKSGRIWIFCPDEKIFQQYEDLSQWALEVDLQKKRSWQANRCCYACLDLRFR